MWQSLSSSTSSSAAGLFGVPLWAYANRFLPGTVFANIFLGVVLLLARTVCASVELWVIASFLQRTLQSETPWKSCDAWHQTPLPDTPLYMTPCWSLMLESIVVLCNASYNCHSPLKYTRIQQQSQTASWEVLIFDESIKSACLDIIIRPASSVAKYSFWGSYLDLLLMRERLHYIQPHHGNVRWPICISSENYCCISFWCLPCPS